MGRLTGRSMALLALAVSGFASFARGDSAVAVGIGPIGDWKAAVYVANPNSSAEVLTFATAPKSCDPLQNCITVPPIGSSLTAAGSTPGIQTLYVTQQSTETPFPVIQFALVNNVFSPPRSVNIPSVLLSRLMAANISTLNFANVSYVPPTWCGIGVICSAFSNLILANVQRTENGPGEDLPITLELFDPSGIAVASMSLTIGYGETVLLENIGVYLGAAPLLGGQLRVRRVAGTALMWGVLYTQSPDGAVTASAGVNLSP